MLTERSSFGKDNSKETTEKKSHNEKNVDFPNMPPLRKIKQSKNISLNSALVEENSIVKNKIINKENSDDFQSSTNALADQISSKILNSSDLLKLNKNSHSSQSGYENNQPGSDIVQKSRKSTKPLRTTTVEDSPPPYNLNDNSKDGFDDISIDRHHQQPFEMASTLKKHIPALEYLSNLKTEPCLQSQPHFVGFQQSNNYNNSQEQNHNNCDFGSDPPKSTDNINSQNSQPLICSSEPIQPISSNDDEKEAAAANLCLLDSLSNFTSEQLNEIIDEYGFNNMYNLLKSPQQGEITEPLMNNCCGGDNPIYGNFANSSSNEGEHIDGNAPEELIEFITNFLNSSDLNCSLKVENELASYPHLSTNLNLNTNLDSLVQNDAFCGGGSGGLGIGIETCGIASSNNPHANVNCDYEEQYNSLEQQQFINDYVDNFCNSVEVTEVVDNDTDNILQSHTEDITTHCGISATDAKIQESILLGDDELSSYMTLKKDTFRNPSEVANSGCSFVILNNPDGIPELKLIQNEENMAAITNSSNGLATSDLTNMNQIENCWRPNSNQIFTNNWSSRTFNGTSNEFGLGNNNYNLVTTTTTTPFTNGNNFSLFNNNTTTLQSSLGAAFSHSIHESECEGFNILKDFNNNESSSTRACGGIFRPHSVMNNRFSQIRPSATFGIKETSRGGYLNGGASNGGFFAFSDKVEYHPFQQDSSEKNISIPTQGEKSNGELYSTIDSINSKYDKLPGSSNQLKLNQKPQTDFSTSINDLNGTYPIVGGGDSNGNALTQLSCLNASAPLGNSRKSGSIATNMNLAGRGGRVRPGSSAFLSENHGSSTLNSTDELSANQRRMSHNMNERKRRADLRQSFNHIAKLVPSLSQQNANRLSKVKILNECTSHIRSSVSKMNTIQKLKERQQELAKEIISTLKSSGINLKR